MWRARESCRGHGHAITPHTYIYVLHIAYTGTCKICWTQIFYICAHARTQRLRHRHAVERACTRTRTHRHRPRHTDTHTAHTHTQVPSEQELYNPARTQDYNNGRRTIIVRITRNYNPARAQDYARRPYKLHLASEQERPGKVTHLTPTPPQTQSKAPKSALVARPRRGTRDGEEVDN